MTDHIARRNGCHFRLGWFLVWSAAIHASVLIAHHAAPERIEAGEERGALSVSLNTAAPHGPTGFRQTATDEPAAHLPTMDRAAMPVPAAATPSRIANDEGQNADASNRVRAQVISELARHFRYPSLARQRGWEGRVLLGFRVDTDGRLRLQRVLHTSGFAVLDQAALDSLRQVERVTDTGSAQLDLRVSVLYHLTDSY
jgi:TonB family protein